MATRSRLNWAPDSRGYYTRQIGWERSKSGKLQQHKFLLGTDRKQAEIRERKLRELWDQFEKSCAEPRPLWPVALLEIAARIAKGIPDIPVPRAPREMQHQYAARLQRMQAKYPVICFIPEDQHAYEIGQAALELFEAVPIAVPDFKVELLTDDQVLARKKFSIWHVRQASRLIRHSKSPLPCGKIPEAPSTIWGFSSLVIRRRSAPPATRNRSP